PPFGLGAPAEIPEGPMRPAERVLDNVRSPSLGDEARLEPIVGHEQEIIAEGSQDLAEGLAGPSTCGFNPGFHTWQRNFSRRVLDHPLSQYSRSIGCLDEGWDYRTGPRVCQYHRSHSTTPSSPANSGFSQTGASGRLRKRISLDRQPEQRAR